MKTTTKTTKVLNTVVYIFAIAAGACLLILQYAYYGETLFPSVGL